MTALRVRFAPSPTGSLHLGGVRTALYNYLLAKSSDGSFVIRVEDTDLERNQVDAAVNQMNDLKWLGMSWQEGPDVGGDYAPYHQSQRQLIYKEYAEKLIQDKKAFYCFLTDAELEALHSHENRQLISPHRDLAEQEVQSRIEAGEAYVVRFRNDMGKKEYAFEDLIHGQTTLHADMVGDFVLIRSNGQPVYNFCCVIDDHLMNISHVLRGEEHLSNTLRQLMVYEALGFTSPYFGHLSMILGPNRKKLSKRDDAAALSDFISGGFLPQAILNYVALLGWSSADAQEIFTLSELTERFSLERVNKSPAMFDREKLRWINHQHLKQLPTDQVFLALKEQMNFSVDQEWFTGFWGHLGEQFFTLDEVIESIHYFTVSPKQTDEQLDAEGLQVITMLKEKLAAMSDEHLSEVDFQDITQEISSQLSVKGRKLFVPIRLALIGISSGIEIRILVDLLSRSEMLKRIDACLMQS